MEKESYKNFKSTYLLTLIDLQEEFEKLDFTLPESEIIWAYLVNLDCIEYVPTNSINPKDSDLYRVDDAESIQKITSIIGNILEESFELSNLNERSYKTLVAYFVNMLLLSKVSSNFQSCPTL